MSRADTAIDTVCEWANSLQHAPDRRLLVLDLTRPACATPTATDLYKNAMLLKTALLFVATAIAEIVGCFLPYLWLRKGGSSWLLLPAAASLALFVWLLTLHPAASGRVYAAYGGVYVATALVWLRFVDGVTLSRLDWAGAAIALCGMAIIVSGWSKGA